MTSSTPIEEALGRAAEHPRFLASADTGPDQVRLEANFAAIEVEIDAPRPSRLTRLLARLGVSDSTIPLVTATPALRRSWLISVLVAVLFAISAASSSTAVDEVERITVFLTTAPLVPLLGVALAFGPGVDPTHEVAVAAPLDSFRLFLIRAITVVTASIAILLVASALIPDGGTYRIAWLLPAMATTAATMALATRFDPRVAAGLMAAAWVVIVISVVQVASPSDAFGPPVQLISIAVSASNGFVFFRRRRRLDILSVR